MQKNLPYVQEKRKRQAQAPKNVGDSDVKYTHVDEGARDDNNARAGNETNNEEAGEPTHEASHDDTVRVEQDVDVEQLQHYRTFGNDLYLLV